MSVRNSRVKVVSLENMRNIEVEIQKIPVAGGPGPPFPRVDKKVSSYQLADSIVAVIDSIVSFADSKVSIVASS